jgi:hypothetical protein
MRDGIARVRRLFEGLQQRKIELLRAVIVIDEHGLTRNTLFSDGSSYSAATKWSEISRIVAFKEDFAAFDLLCMGLTGREGTMVIDEEMEGFDAMIQALPLHLPGAPEVDQWWAAVIHPAFATNFTVLYRREPL